MSEQTPVAPSAPLAPSAPRCRRPDTWRSVAPLVTSLVLAYAVLTQPDLILAGLGDAAGAVADAFSPASPVSEQP